MTEFLAELRRRRVLPVAGAYLAAGFLAVEIVQFLLQQGNSPEWTTKLIAIAYVVGFPVAVFLAWVIQVDEQGVHRWDTSGSEFRTIATTVVFGVALTVVLAWLIIPGGEQKPGYEPFPNSLAVLPFATTNGTTNELTIASTLRTVLLDGLDQSPELTQIRLRIDERPADLVGFGRQFKVGSLLFGDVTRSAGETRIDIQLLDVVTAEVRWSDSIVWDPTRIKDIGARVANDVLQATGLAAVEPRLLTGTANDDAYLAYVRGLEHRDVYNASELARAIEFFEAAIEFDPGFVRAHATLASTREIYASLSGAQGSEHDELTAAARAAASAALDLDENSPDAISVLARLSDNPLVQQQLLERALEIEPDHPASLLRYALLVSEREGNYEQAERLLRRRLELDPLDANSRSELGFLLWHMGRRDEALAELDTSVELQPDMPQNYMWLGATSFSDFGDVASAVYLIRKAYSVNPEGGFYAVYVATGYAELGMREQALQWLARANELGPQLDTVQFYRFVVHRRLGDNATADQFLRDYAQRFDDQRVFLMTRLLAASDVRDGRPDEGIARFLGVFPQAAEGNLQLNDQTVPLVLAYADVLRQAGKTDEAERLIDRVVTFADSACAEGREQLCDLGWRAYAGTRDRERTLASLRNEIVDRRDREYNAEFDDPALDWLRDDPDFAELMGVLQDDLAKQRDWVIARECSGEMPPAPGVEMTIDCG